MTDQPAQLGAVAHGDHLEVFHERRLQPAEQVDFAAVEREALEIRQRQEELSDERDLLAGAIDAARPWGEFHLPVEEEHSALRFWFYVVPHYRRETIQESGLVWQVVARDERFDYVVVVHPEQPQGM